MASASDHKLIARPAAPGTFVLAAIAASLFFLFLHGMMTLPFPWVFAHEWVPSLGIIMALRIDGLSGQFLLLISGIGVLVFVYAAGYLSGVQKNGRVLFLLFLFMLSMMGAVVSDHVILLFVFWELTSVISFLLVGFSHEDAVCRRSAQQTLMVTGLGGLFLLAGFLVLWDIGGTGRIHDLVLRAPDFLDDKRLPVALCLVFVGAFTKSAQFPFHFWLPNAMAAPTPVSAYLHSATLVKLGVYLLARLDGAFGSLLLWQIVLIGFGTLTAVGAALLTLRETDMKRMLAWSTVSTLGTLTMLVGIPGHGAALAVATLFFAHALYKAPLFFVAGNLDHGTGTRDVDALGGMVRSMPWTASCAILAAISMAGLPLTFGFIAKDAMIMAKSEAAVFEAIGYATIFVGSVSVAVASIVSVRLFFGRFKKPGPDPAHEVSFLLIVPPMILVILGVLFGLNPTLVDPILGSAARVMAPGFDESAVEAAYDLYDVIAAVLSILVLGSALYLGLKPLRVLLEWVRVRDLLAPESGYWKVLKAVPRLAAWQTRCLQHGRLSHYLRVFVAAMTVVLLALLAAGQPQPDWPLFDTLTLPTATASLLVVSGAVLALFVRDHLLLVLVSGIVGYGSAVLFLFSGAPDLAFTQFAVETVFVVVAATVLRRMRPAQGRSRQVVERRLRMTDLALSSGLALVLTMLLLMASGLSFDGLLGDFFLANSLPAAKGQNVVNVIIVDFRAMDTLGEISVLAFSLLAAWPLLHMTKGDKA